MGIWQAALKRDLTAEEKTRYIKENAFRWQSQDMNLIKVMFGVNAGVWMSDGGTT